MATNFSMAPRAVPVTFWRARVCNSWRRRLETKFARMKYTGAGLFELAFMRYTGEWVEVYAGLTLDACLSSIRDDEWFHP